MTRTFLTASLILASLQGAALLCPPSQAAQTVVMSPQPAPLGSVPAAATAPAQAGAAAQPDGVPLTGLPAPAVDDDAPPVAFLDAARRAIAANRTGEAQEALERAESRVLSRPVKPSKAGEPSTQKLVKEIAQARQALGEGDRLRAVQLIETAMALPEASAEK
jgi:hypothetical protein